MTLTTRQFAGKDRCFYVRKFGAKPAVVSEFWITAASATTAFGSIKSSGRSQLQKTRHQVPMEALFPTKKDAAKARDTITEATPLPDYTNPKVVFADFRGTEGQCTPVHSNPVRHGVLLLTPIP